MLMYLLIFWGGILVWDYFVYDYVSYNLYINKELKLKIVFMYKFLYNDNIVLIFIIYILFI